MLLLAEPNGRTRNEYCCPGVSDDGLKLFLVMLIVLKSPEVSESSYIAVPSDDGQLIWTLFTVQLLAEQVPWMLGAEIQMHFISFIE